MLELHIPGDPIGKKRPRFARIGKDVRTYKDPKEETAEGIWAWKAKALIPSGFQKIPKGCAVHLDIQFQFVRPSAHFGTGRNRDKLKPSAPVEHTQTPDVENCEKFACDVMTKMLEIWADDCQVVSCMSSKQWADSGEEGETRIWVDWDEAEAERLRPAQAIRDAKAEERRRQRAIEKRQSGVSRPAD